MYSKRCNSDLTAFRSLEVAFHERWKIEINTYLTQGFFNGKSSVCHDCYIRHSVKFLYKATYLSQHWIWQKAEINRRDERYGIIKAPYMRRLLSCNKLLQVASGIMLATTCNFSAATHILVQVLVSYHAGMGTNGWITQNGRSVDRWRQWCCRVSPPELSAQTLTKPTNMDKRVDPGSF